MAIAIAFSSMRVSAMPTTNAMSAGDRRREQDGGHEAELGVRHEARQLGQRGSLHRGRDRGQRRDVRADAHERDVAEA